MEYVEEECSIEEALENSIQFLMKERAKYGPLTQEYFALTQRIADETETLKNARLGKQAEIEADVQRMNKHATLWNMLGNVAGNIAGTTIGSLINRSNVKTVVGYEQDGGIVNSKGMTFITKPKG